MNIYQSNGYLNRREYLNAMAEDYGVEYRKVLEIAAILGPEEDFDALVIYLEEIAELDL